MEQRKGQMRVKFLEEWSCCEWIYLVPDRLLLDDTEDDGPQTYLALYGTGRDASLEVSEASAYLTWTITKVRDPTLDVRGRQRHRTALCDPSAPSSPDLKLFHVDHRYFRAGRDVSVSG
nr:hypothetical protein CFP56_73959 [Quercus suber]